MASEKINERLYGGSVVVEFSPNTHRYTVNGKPGTPSVTSVTGLLNKPALLFWAANLGRDFLLAHKQAGTEITEELIQEAAKQHTIKKTAEATSGTLVHEWCEAFIKGKNPEMPDDPRVLNGVNAFLTWVDEHGVKFLESEKVVYSRKHKFVGILDCIFTMKAEKHKVPHLGDFKTSSGIYPEMTLQAAAYQAADEEESERIFGDKWIIRFGKDDGVFEAKSFPYKQHDDDFKAFLGLLAAKRWLAEQK